MTKRELKRAKAEAGLRKASLSIRYGIFAVLRYLLVGFVLVSVVNLVFSYFFYTPKMQSIGRGNVELAEKYKILGEKIRSLGSTLDRIKHRDNAVYRALFGADTLDIPGVYVDYPDSKYARLADDRFAGIMTSAWKNLDAAARRLYLQSVSLDELQLLAVDKEKMATSIPALLPIDIQKFTRISSNWGNRLHPIYRRYIFHHGIDLGGHTGDPIYATGDGFVSFTGTRSGYGNNIDIDHGFGYTTRYAHLSKILVTRGQFVKRGELIAEMGSTGVAKGPHLHYEVIYMGHDVNPVSYFQTDMDPAEFEKIIESANNNTIFEPWDEGVQ